MDASEGLDIRAPLGGLFIVLGGMLAAYGLFAPGKSGSSDLSSGVNVNLWWGLVMLVFGILLLLMARRASWPPAVRTNCRIQKRRPFARRRYCILE